MVADSAAASLAEARAQFNRDPGGAGWFEVYTGACCDTGEAPSSEQARSFRDAVHSQNGGAGGYTALSERLSLRCLRIGAAAANCLAAMLRDAPIRRLDLGENQLGERGIPSVRTLIRALPKLQWLGLSGNLVGLDGAKELAEELESNACLEALILGETKNKSLRANGIGTEGLQGILGALQRNSRSSLVALTLCHANLGSEAGTRLASFLEDDRRIKFLDVSSNPLASEGVTALLQQCDRLISLSIADTGCRGDLVQAPLCALLGGTSCLAHLSLASIQLEMRPLRRIVKAVGGCASLASLDLQRTCLNTEAVTALADALLSAPVHSLTELDLSDNSLNQIEAATALAHTLTGTSLHVLRLNRNALGDAGIRELGDAMEPGLGSVLQHLELECCRVGSVGAAHLLTCIARSQLRVLRLCDNFLDNAIDAGVFDRIDCLHELHLSGNRLSHAMLKRAAQTCSRNRQRARDEEPAALRADVHRLLFQETKVESARKQVAEDSVELNSREQAVEEASRDLRALRSSEAEARRQLTRQLRDEERLLQEAEQQLREMDEEIEAARADFDRERNDVRGKLRNREQELVDVQTERQLLEESYSKEKEDHPNHIASLQAAIKQAHTDTTRFQAQEQDTRAKLKALQAKALIDFKP